MSVEKPVEQVHVVSESEFGHISPNNTGIPQNEKRTSDSDRNLASDVQSKEIVIFEIYKQLNLGLKVKRIKDLPRPFNHGYIVHRRGNADYNRMMLGVGRRR